MKLFVMVILVTGTALAEVRPLMQEFYVLTNKLHPYLTNKTDFMDEKNEKAISTVLTGFVENTKILKKDKMAQNDDMKFRAQLLAEGLDEAEKSFKTGFKDYSFWALKASLNNCFSCHTQKSLVGTNYNFDKNSKHNTYQKAEFFFIVRNYEKSIPLFEEILIHYPKNKVSVEDLESSAQKLLFYSVRVLRDDLKTIKAFEKILKNQNLPSSLRNDFLAWKKYLNIKKYRIEDEVKISNAKDLEIFMAAREQIAEQYTYMNQRAIVDLDTTYFLYQLLEKSTDQDLKPSTLYWLASIEEKYRLDMFDVAAENYLRECIEKYSINKVAKKCFSLYKEIKIASFTGSRGTDMPKSVTDQLKKYETLVNKK
ncbi:MAG: hypothetical protein AABY53_04565 [Bdellovibrionota bacterium]